MMLPGPCADRETEPLDDESLEEVLDAGAWIGLFSADLPSSDGMDGDAQCPVRCRLLLLMC